MEPVHVDAMQYCTSNIVDLIGPEQPELLTICPAEYLATHRLTAAVFTVAPLVARRADAAVVGPVASASVVAQYPCTVAVDCEVRWGTGGVRLTREIAAHQ